MYLFFHPEITSTFQLGDEESHHALRVLRLNQGDIIHLTDGKGTFATARIEHTTKSNCTCGLISSQQYPKKKYSISLAIAPTKNSDRIEWMVEKCVEFGIDSFIFIGTQHGERKKINIDRIKKITLAALKQSQQYWLPAIQEMSFENILQQKADQKFIAHVDQTNPQLLQKEAKPGLHYLVLIGPEGDFSASEIDWALQAGFRKVSLGPNRLRTETAGLVGMVMMVTR